MQAWWWNSNSASQKRRVFRNERKEGSSESRIQGSGSRWNYLVFSATQGDPVVQNVSWKVMVLYSYTTPANFLFSQTQLWHRACFAAWSARYWILDSNRHGRDVHGNNECLDVTKFFPTDQLWVADADRGWCYFQFLRSSNRSDWNRTDSTSSEIPSPSLFSGSHWI